MTLSKLQANLSPEASSALPPVDKWDPPFCGDIAISIDRDGRWFYQGSPIGRQALVTLFSSVLKMEGSDYFLVTPVEKVRIQVDDVPFIITQWQADDNGLHFTTQTGDMLTVDDNTSTELRSVAGTQVPYIKVRRNLWARLHQNVFYQLIGQATEHHLANGDIVMQYGSGRSSITLGYLVADQNQ